MDILKISFLGIITAVLYAIIRNIKPEIAPLIVLAGSATMLVLISERLIGVTGSVNEMMSLAGIEKENVSILLKALGICFVSQFAADVCYDNSCSTLAATVELAGRVGAIIISAPMLKSVAELAIGLING
jgi:stage III sporulation protein AD